MNTLANGQRAPRVGPGRRKTGVADEVIVIPPESRDRFLVEFCLPTRLQNLLQTVQDLVHLLRQAANGQFDVPQEFGSGESYREALQWIDDAISTLPQRNQEVLLWHLGGYGGEPLTFQELSARFLRTRGRMHQVVKRAIPRVLRAGGPRLARFLGKVDDWCRETVCPLTPEVLAQWVGAETSQCRYPVSFYVRLLDKLISPIPPWPGAHDGPRALSPHDKAVIVELRRLLGKPGRTLPLREAFLRLRNERLAGLMVSDFLRALRSCRSVKVTFKTPTQPEVERLH